MSEFSNVFEDEFDEDEDEDEEDEEEEEEEENAEIIFVDSESFWWWWWRLLSSFGDDDAALNRAALNASILDILFASIRLRLCTWWDGECGDKDDDFVEFGFWLTLNSKKKIK